MWRKGARLAEIIGIMLGDGCLYLDYKNKYHSVITLSKKELTYATHVMHLFQNFFKGYSFYITEIPAGLQVRNVSVRIGSFLVRQGLLVGNKVKNQVGVPKWIFTRDSYLLSFLKGIFDTDGCVYNKYNWFMQVQFKFASFPLINDTRNILLILGFHPTKLQEEKSKNRLAWKFYLSRQNEIHRFFGLVKPSNNKHLSRYAVLINKQNAFK